MLKATGSAYTWKKNRQFEPPIAENPVYAFTRQHSAVMINIIQFCYLLSPCVHAPVRSYQIYSPVLLRSCHIQYVRLPDVLYTAD